MMTQPFPIGPIMLDLQGVDLEPVEREKIAHPNTGAVILFSRNYDSTEQITHLINDIRQCRNGPLLIAVDQEGGRVQRFLDGFTRLPPAAAYAVKPGLAEHAGWLMASELLSVGVDFSFAPVLDIDCGISEVIGDRSFSKDCDQAIELAQEFVDGMHAAGMAATGKHFPGHGAVAADSHLALPVDSRSLEEISRKDLRPFKQLIAHGLEAVMPAHVLYPAVDDVPAGFSTRWIQQILRQQLMFQGAVFSDDLSMLGAESMGDFVDRAVLAQRAGCDMLLVCNKPAEAEKVLQALPVIQDPARTARLEAMQAKRRVDREQLLNATQYQNYALELADFSAAFAAGRA